MHKIYPWQQPQWQHLIDRASNGSLPHGLLLTGQPGIGKIDFAYAFAEYLLCEQSEQQACGECRICKLIAANTHPDLHVLHPEENSNKIKVDQIRNVINKITMQSHQGGYQVVIIEPADAMNIAASNALLKTLEEPHANIIIILVTAKPSLLPATISSRCQKLVCYAPKKDDADSWLANNGVNNAHTLLKLTENSPLGALRLADPEIQQQYTNLLDAFLGLMIKEISIVKFAEVYSKVEIDVFAYLQQLLRDIILVKLSLQPEYLIHDKNIDVLAAIGETTHLDKLFSCYDKIVILRNKQENNLNRQMLLEDIAVSLMSSHSVS